MTAPVELVASRHVVLCCGTGGVGKTTTAATLAIEGARRGRNAVVVTIDPAKRLANTLGLETLSNSAHEIPRERWDLDGDAAPEGRLHALMLDTETTFDQLVQTYARTDDQATGILSNRFYRNIAGALSGTQEYMAMEKLYELHDRGGFDLIVVDTPPTRHALDFLDAPRRLTRLLDNRVFRMLMVPTRGVVRVGGVAAQAFLRTISRVVGTEAVDDVVAFFRAFEGMEEGFRDRAEQVMQLLGADDTAFVLVTSPRRDAVEEAEFFARRLAESEFTVDALVVNRVHEQYSHTDPAALRDRARQLAGRRSEASSRLAAHYANLADLDEVARRERAELAGLEDRIGDASIVHVPELAHDVHDFAALRAVGNHLMGGD
jgi:anion-transporting  ArsA/GET3 family ATPase